MKEWRKGVVVTEVMERNKISLDAHDLARKVRLLIFVRGG